MTPADRAIYDSMPPRDRERIDALSEGLRPAALSVWASLQKPRRQRPAGYVPWDQRPASRALIDREPGDPEGR